MGFGECFLKNKALLMEGALGERLKREYGLKIDGTVAMASLVYSEDGRSALKNLWEGYADIAKRHSLSFIATTPTRRANKERMAESGYGDKIIKDNVDFLRSVQSEFKCESYIGGLMGCKGDAYTGEGAMNTDEAEEFHSYAAKLFKKAGADFLYAGIMPCRDEALGMAKAMEKTGLPYIISFMIRKNGCLIDGTPIAETVEFIDNNTERKPVCYMSNCVHPAVLESALNQKFNAENLYIKRILGLQANTSPLSPEELDNAEELFVSEPKELADGMESLERKFGIKIWGGCCGTDNRHIEEFAKRISDINVEK